MIVTHFKPDFDCIVATWVLKRFCGKQNDSIKFIRFGEPIPKRYENAIFVDIGGGEFDHHSRSDFVSSAYLILEKYNLKNDCVLNELADIARRIDHGIYDSRTHGILNLISIISGLNILYPNDPTRVIDIAFHCLDAVYERESKIINFDEELEKGIKFQTKWGKGVGIETKSLRIREYCYKKGYKIFVYLNPENQYRGYSAKEGCGADFSELYKILKKLEPDAEWHLHFTKDLLICGSDKAINKIMSKLNLEELINLIKIHE